MPVAKSKRFAHTGRRPNEERRQAVATLYQSGLSIHAVSELIGVSPQAVHSMLQRMGVQLRARGGNQGSHSRHRK
jgi:transposase-like protein